MEIRENHLIFAFLYAILDHEKAFDKVSFMRIYQHDGITREAQREAGASMITRTRYINRTKIMGWSAISIILLVTSVSEAIKGERTLSYLFAFIPAVFSPLLVVLVLYRKKPIGSSFAI